MRLGTLEFQYSNSNEWFRSVALASGNGSWIMAVADKEVMVYEIGERELSDPRSLGRVDGVVAGVAVDPLGRFVATADTEGQILLWSLTETAAPAILHGPPEIRLISFTTDGSLIEASAVVDGNGITWVWDLSGNSPRFLRRFHIREAKFFGGRWDTDGKQVARWGNSLTNVRIWSMDAPPSAEPLVLNRGDNQQMNDVSFSPAGPWLATADAAGLAIWPIVRDYPQVFRSKSGQIRGLAFDPAGRWLVSSATDGAVKLWPLEGNPPQPERDLGFGNVALTVSPDGDRILAGAQGGNGVNVFYPDGRSSTNLSPPRRRDLECGFYPRRPPSRGHWRSIQPGGTSDSGLGCGLRRGRQDSRRG